MIFLAPFKDHSAAGQSGNMLIITGLIASAVAVAGGKVMLDRSAAQREANQMAESMKQAKEIPGSAAMIAKALISIPPNVAANKSIEWTTNKLVTSPGNMPLVYPIPYVSGAIGSPAMPAKSVSQTVTPPSGANWDTFGVAGTTLAVGGVFASAQVNVYTNDSTRATSQDVNLAISGKAVSGGNATVARTKSVVTYSFRNCTPNGVSSATFTGRYCATASIKSPNYASAVKRTLKDQDLPQNPNINEGVAELGLIEAPPKPVCGTISTPGNAKVKSGNAFSLDVKATGVAVGYNVRLISPSVDPSTLATSGNTPIRLSLDHPRLERVHTISGIPTSDPSVKAALDQAGVSAMTLSVDLTAIDGSVTPCDDVTVQLDKPIVACESGSFAVSRTGADKRTCSISLRKDNGMGAVKQVRIVQTNATTGTATTSSLAASFSANNWSSSVPCSQDGWTFNAFLTREYPIGTAISDSQCSPQQAVSELPPKCDGTSALNKNPARGSPPNLLTCNVTVVRAPDSHSGATIWIDNIDRTSSGTWAANVWTGNVPCAADAVTLTAELKKDAASSTCWSKTIDAVEPPRCIMGSTTVTKTGTPSSCVMKVKKSAVSGFINSVKINNAASAGNWIVDLWTSGSFSCDPSSTYTGSLTGVDNVASDCGTFTFPPVCASMTASRQSTTSETCNVTITKGSGGGRVASASVNSSVISSIDQASYTTTTPCASAGATISGFLSNAGGAGSCPNATVSPVVCTSSFQQCTGTAAECMALADSGLVITPSSTTTRSTVGSDTVFSFYAGNNAKPANTFTVGKPGKVYVLLVGGGGGAGGWQTSAGGAGGGGVKRGLLTVCPGTFSVSVGVGGTGNANSKSLRGADSIINGNRGAVLTARGGGTSSSTDQDGCPAGGWGPSNKPPVNPANAREWMYNYAGTAFCYGGSGGGGTPLWGKSWPGGRPYNDPVEEGNLGGIGWEKNPIQSSNPSAGGGGGGAGTAGGDALVIKNAAGVVTSVNGGNGGDGIQSDITGTISWYAGGGGGGRFNVVGTPGIGGQGGGGAGCAGAGVARTGGGGGGGCNSGAGGNGGPGIVVIRFK